MPHIFPAHTMCLCMQLPRAKHLHVATQPPATSAARSRHCCAAGPRSKGFENPDTTEYPQMEGKYLCRGSWGLHAITTGAGEGSWERPNRTARGFTYQGAEDRANQGCRCRVETIFSLIGNVACDGDPSGFLSKDLTEDFQRRVYCIALRGCHFSWSFPCLIWPQDCRPCMELVHHLCVVVCRFRSFAEIFEEESVISDKKHCYSHCSV